MDFPLALLIYLNNTPLPSTTTPRLPECFSPGDSRLFGHIPRWRLRGDCRVGGRRPRKKHHSPPHPQYVAEMSEVHHGGTESWFEQKLGLDPRL